MTRRSTLPSEPQDTAGGVGFLLGGLACSSVFVVALPCGVCLLNFCTFRVTSEVFQAFPAFALAFQASVRQVRGLRRTLAGLDPFDR